MGEMEERLLEGSLAGGREVLVLGLALRPAVHVLEALGNSLAVLEAALDDPEEIRGRDAGLPIGGESHDLARLVMIPEDLPGSRREDTTQALEARHTGKLPGDPLPLRDHMFLERPDRRAL